MGDNQILSVDDYIASRSEGLQRLLICVRNAIRSAVPGAEESISYGMPTYKLNGAAMLYFAGWKRHYSLYPASDRLVAAFKDDLAAYEIENGTVRFPLSKPVPEELIARIAKFRAEEILERQTG